MKLNINRIDLIKKITRGFPDGYGAEIAEEWVNVGFTRLHLTRISAIAEEQNFVSQKLLRKVGFIEFSREFFLGMNAVRFEIKK